MERICRDCKTPYDSEGHPNGWDLGLCSNCNEKYEREQKKINDEEFGERGCN